MTRGLGYETHFTLSHMIVAEPTGGIYVSDFAAILKYRRDAESLQIGLAVSSYQPMIELYLIAKSIKHEIKKSRDRTLVSGVTYKSTDVRDLVEILTRGIQNNAETSKKAETLYNKVFNRG